MRAEFTSRLSRESKGTETATPLLHPRQNALRTISLAPKLLWPFPWYLIRLIEPMNYCKNTIVIVLGTGIHLSIPIIHSDYQIIHANVFDRKIEFGKELGRLIRQLPAEITFDHAST